MGAVDYACIYDRTMLNAANPLLLELLIQFFPGVYPLPPSAKRKRLMVL